MQIESLRKLLYTNLNWHPARILTFYNLIKSIILCKSVTVKNMAVHIESKGNIRAKIAKIERLFSKQNFDYNIIAKIILGMLAVISPYIVAIDRTNWQFGKSNLNFFVASIVIHNISVPFCWILLDKKGSTSTAERIDLIKKILSIIGKENIKIVLGDREFIGEEWLKYLYNEQIPFAMRAKKNEQLKHHNGGKISLEKYFSRSEEESSKEIIFYGIKLNATYLKIKKDMLFIISNSVIGESALTAYKKRWSIERAFKALKTSGFNFENTHITNQIKLAKLFSVAAISLAICVISGEIKNEIYEIKTKKHGRKAFSLFTYGLDWLRDYFSSKNVHNLKRLFNLLNWRISQAFT